MKLDGIVARGYRVASGTSVKDTRFPGGTVRMQAPFFAANGLDIDAYFNGKQVWGSLNVDIFPYAYRQVKSDFFMPMVHWTPLQSPENFFLSHAKVIFDGHEYKALLYNPDPSTKPNHFQYPSIIEFIAEKIEGIGYDSKVVVEVPDGHLELTKLEGREAPQGLPPFEIKQ